jgi:glyoxylase-like metal-dependent hydrolase (beta-lactamase superfamily II)
VLERDVAKGIHRVEDAHVNWYLVEDGGALTVVDTGFPASWQSLQAALTSLGRAASDIAGVVLTHAHVDHIGFADRARRELGVDVWAHEAEQRLLRHPWRYKRERNPLLYSLRRPMLNVEALQMGLAGALSVRGFDGTRAFASGDELDLPGHPRAVFTPGHTHGHCSLHFPDRGAIVAGDALVTWNLYTGEKGPRLMARAATADSGLALASLDAIEQTGAEVLLPGHGEPWRGGVAEAVSRAREAGLS